MEILAKVIEIVTKKLSVPIALFMSVLLFSPDKWLVSLALNSFVEKHITAIWLIFIFAIILIVYELSKLLIKKIKRLIYKRSVISEVKENLLTLSEKERAVIYYCMRDNKNTVNATEVNSTLVSLVNKEIFNRPVGNYSNLNVPYRIPPHVWKYIKKKKDDFCSDDQIKDEDFNRRINRFIGGLRDVLSD